MSTALQGKGTVPRNAVCQPHTPVIWGMLSFKHILHLLGKARKKIYLGGNQPMDLPQIVSRAGVGTMEELYREGRQL